MPESASALPLEPAERARALVQRLGPHPATRVGLALEADDDDALGRWLVAAILFSHRASTKRAAEAFRSLERADLAHPAGISTAGAVAVEERLLRADVERADGPASVIFRASGALAEAFDGRLSKLAGQAEGLDDLGGRLAHLASGFGRAGVTLFLQPLRELWVAADELPLDPAAAAAAVHLGWLEPDDEPSAAALRRALGDAASDLAFCDVEAALGTLGRSGCRRDAPGRCALGAACPAAHRNRPAASS